MKYISYYHGYPLALGTKDKGWRSCYNWKPLGLRWINSILVWLYHNKMCYNNLKYLKYADKIICISHSRRKQLIAQARVIEQRGFIGMLIYNIKDRGHKN